MDINHRIITDSSIRRIVRIRSMRLSQRWPFRRPERPDIEQAMLLHLVQRWHRYNSDIGTPEMFVEAALSNWERQQHRNARCAKRIGRRKEASLQQFGDDSFADSKTRTPLEIVSVQELLERCLDRLDENEIQLVRLLSENSERVVVEVLGQSRRQVRNQRSLILAKCIDLMDPCKKADHF